MLSFASSESERFTGGDLYWEEPKISATAELVRFRLSNRSARTGPGATDMRMTDMRRPSVCSEGFGEIAIQSRFEARRAFFEH